MNTVADTRPARTLSAPLVATATPAPVTTASATP
jgi:hypothetical protein